MSSSDSPLFFKWEKTDIHLSSSTSLHLGQMGLFSVFTLLEKKLNILWQVEQ